MSHQKFLLIPWIFLIVGMITLVFSYKSYLDTQQFLHESIKTIGSVVEMKSERDSHNNIGYKPILTYEDRTGIEHTFIANTSKNPSTYKIGDQVELFYDPLQPDKAVINTWKELYVQVLILGTFGGIFVLIPAVGFYSSSRRQKKVGSQKIAD